MTRGRMRRLRRPPGHPRRATVVVCPQADERRPPSRAASGSRSRPACVPRRHRARTPQCPPRPGGPTLSRWERNMAGDASSYDVIVIGGGFAGVTAARDADHNGRAVLLVEARDRLGGRTWYRPFLDGEQQVEFGGTWLRPSPSCRHVWGEVERYGLDLIQSPDPHAFASYVGGRRIDGPFPVPREQ